MWHISVTEQSSLCGTTTVRYRHHVIEAYQEEL